MLILLITYVHMADNLVANGNPVVDYAAGQGSSGRIALRGSPHNRDFKIWHNWQIMSPTTAEIKAVHSGSNS